MKKILFILLFCILSCEEHDPSVVTIHDHFALPTVTVVIKGKPVEMIMDTGGAITIIDDDLARELAILPTGESREIRGYGGSKKISLAEEVPLVMGTLPIHAQVYISDIDAITGTKQVKGILGIEHLKDAVIDLKNNTITFE